jgi:hypothetical protein
LFLVLKEYRCSDEIGKPRDCTPVGEVIRLISPDLCTSLASSFDFGKRDLSFALPDFSPQMELRAPYHWFYHLQEDLVEPLYDLRYTAVTYGVLGPVTIHQPVSRHLLRFIAESMASEYQRIHELLNVRQMITWNDLLYLFVRILSASLVLA